MHGAIADDCMDAGGRAMHGAIAEPLSAPVSRFMGFTANKVATRGHKSRRTAL